MGKESFCICTTPSGYHYCYNSSLNYLILINDITKYIIDNYVSTSNIDRNGCDGDDYLKTQDPNSVDYSIQKVDFFRKNGFFKEVQETEIKETKTTATKVKDNFANANHLVFEVTEMCNLNCTYCVYGDYYNYNNGRSCSNMTFETAQAIIDYKVNLWLSHYNNSAKITKIIGFYGGEPLLNIDLIKQIVSYTKDLEKLHELKFKFNMTTNGVLLDKYLDYLVENDFLLTLSLDGDDYHNQYRVYKNNTPCFTDVVKNIRLCQEKYGEYFQKNVDFNSVLHHKSDIDRISDFFSKSFNKQAQISELSSSSDNKALEYLLYKEDNNIYIDNFDHKFFLRNDDTKLFNFDTYLSHYSLLTTIHRNHSFYSGTCTPFSKSVFVTAKGVIMICEKIPHKYAIGKINKDKSIDIDFNKAAVFFNDTLKERMNKCMLCYKIPSCSQCVFMLENRSCSKFATKDEFKSETTKHIRYYERNVDLIEEQSSWLYLHQFVHFVKKQSQMIIYNELNHSLLEYNNIKDPLLLCILERFNTIPDETYAVELKESELNHHAVKAFINEIKSNFSGDIISKKNQTKPFVRKPLINIINNVEFNSIDQEYLISYRLKLSIKEITINTGLSFHSRNPHIFKHKEENFYSYEVYNYFDLIASQIAELRQIKQVNIICHKDSQLDKILPFAETIRQFARVHIYVEIRDVERVINAFGHKFVYTIYFEPTREDFELIINLSKNTSNTMIPFVQIRTDEDIENVEKLSSEFSFECNMYPILTKNSNILHHFIKSKEDILEQKLSIKDIRKNEILNKDSFGKVYINEQGDISTLGLKESSFNIKDRSIMDFAFDQIKNRKDWFLTRSSVEKCKSCVFQDMCPPISAHEIFLNKYDLCNIE